jgi:hypothetical protein
VFESATRLEEDVRGLLAALRSHAGGRYAALFDARGVFAESPEGGGDGGWALRRFIESRGRDLLGIAEALHSGAEMQDHFEDWTADEFFLVFVNRKVGVLVACPDASGVEQGANRLLKALVDRLLRLNPAWRMDEKGRGLFAGSPRLDTVVISRPAETSGGTPEAGT